MRVKSLKSNKTIDKLIKAVKSRPILYDPAHHSHQKEIELNKTWMEIANELNVNKQQIKTLKRHWNEVRREYVKNRRYTTRKSTNLYKHTRGSKLDFLEPYLTSCSDSSSSESDHTEKDSEIEIPISQKDEIKYLFLGYSKTFRKLKPKVQVSLKLKLAKLFLKTEWEEMQNRDFNIPLKMETTYSDDD